MSPSRINTIEDLLEDIDTDITELDKTARKALRTLVFTVLALAPLLWYIIGTIETLNPTLEQYRTVFYLTGLIGFMTLILISGLVGTGPLSKSLFRRMPVWMREKAVVRSALFMGTLLMALVIMLLCSFRMDWLTMPLYFYAAFFAWGLIIVYLKHRKKKGKRLIKAVEKEFSRRKKRTHWGAVSSVLQFVVVFVLPAVSLYLRKDDLFSALTVKVTMLFLALIPFACAVTIFHLVFYESCMKADSVRIFRTEIAENKSGYSFSELAQKWQDVRNS